MLYPLKFEPIFKYRIWGGNKLKNILNKTEAPAKTGESWEISGVEDSLSVVSNGPLAGNTIHELIEVYMGDLLGDQIYEKFGEEFPLLIKLIDANDILSIQVHPGDELARERHQAYGKTEMWYIIQAEAGSVLYTGFNRELDKEGYLNHLKNNTIKESLNLETAKPGDVFFIPAGRVHATGAGILFAEIQQTSDITYRIFDWNRVDIDGKARELHTDLALDAIDFKIQKEYKTEYTREANGTREILTCDYFTTNIISLDKAMEKDYFEIDSFIIYMCIEGSFTIHSEKNQPTHIKKGETVLIPAILNNIRLDPDGPTSILEVFIP